MKKKVAWIAAMAIVGTLAFVPVTPTAAYAFFMCEEITCKRDLHCGVGCSYCDTPSPIFEGNCALN